MISPGNISEKGTPGRALATIGGFGLLEIAVNQGQAD